ncbi:MAG: hypothetical protein JW779_13995 [Candidatus Thorarchaeota archaeon]|nr:hypothetical protein [Candidatus Thorarchaeota archaeon]
MKIYRILSLSLILILFTISVSSVFSSDLHLAQEKIGTSNEKTDLIHNSIELDERVEECSSVIVTGSAAKDGRAILMKNRDWADDHFNNPIYIPSTSKTFAYVGVNTNTMGINERGLAVMNTAMPILETEPGYGNLELNRKILLYFESVAEVANALNDTYSMIGPTYRSSSGAVATCIGVIDRFGAGAFFEISNTEAYVQYIVDGYDTRANHPRIFPGFASGPNGRDQYLLDALDAVYEKNGIISWADVMQNASRYVREKELGTSSFSIDGEVCNPSTVAAMVAVSGDERYSGKLNVMWGSYGFTPLIGVFVPSMVLAGETPECIADLCHSTNEKWSTAKALSSWDLLNPYRVRELQDVAFYVERYTIEEYDYLLHIVPDDLSDLQIQAYISEYIDRTVEFTASSYIQESKSLPIPPRSIVNLTTPSIIPSTTTTFPTSTVSGTENTTTQNHTAFDGKRLLLGVGIGFSAIVLLVSVLKKRWT